MNRCWIVQFGEVSEADIIRIISPDERSDGVVETTIGTFLPQQVFNHPPVRVKKKDNWGEYTEWE